MDSDAFRFEMSFPCFVVELSGGGGMVAVQTDDGHSLAVLTDGDLAERFCESVVEARETAAKTIQLDSGNDLLACLRKAKNQGATSISLDPSIVRGKMKRSETLIDHAIAQLESLGDHET